MVWTVFPLVPRSKTAANAGVLHIGFIIKYLILTLTLIVSSFCYANEKLGPISKIKPGVASQGSLANEKLIADTVEGFKSKLGSDVINEKTEIIKFVIQNPVGNRSRSTAELRE